MTPVFSVYIIVDTLLVLFCCVHVVSSNVTEETTENTTERDTASTSEVFNMTDAPHQETYPSTFTPFINGSFEYYHYYMIYEYESVPPTEWTTARAVNAIPTFEDMDYYLSQPECIQFLSQFHNEVKRDMIREQLRSCPFTALCGFHLDIPVYDRSIVPCCQQCTCDYPSCLYQQTCCPDVIPDTFFVDVTPGSEVTAPPVELQYLKKCTLLHARYNSKFDQYSDFLYSDCPAGVDPTLNEKCTRVYSPETVSSLEDIVPVETPNDIYRNKYCAECRDVPEDEHEFWEPQLNCNHTIDYEILKTKRGLFDLIFNDNGCDVLFARGLGIPLRICNSIVNVCNVTGLWMEYDPVLERKCHVYTSIYTRHSYYDFQNIFCLQCNGFNVTSTACDDINNSGGTTEYAFSGLLRLESHTSLSETTGTEPETSFLCNPNEEIFDTVTVRTLPVSALYGLLRASEP